MKSLDDKKINEILNRIGRSYKPKADFEKWCSQNPQAVNAIKMQAGKNKTERQIQLWRKFTKSPITKITAAALVIVAVIIWLNRSGLDGTGKVFAAAMDSIKKARTFSCNESWESTRENGEKYVFEQMWMFKEPDRERHVVLTDVNEKFNGRVNIFHYGKRQELELCPFDKTATLYDKSSDYVINPNTGLVELHSLIQVFVISY